jgi:hypothetical protein
MFKVLIRAVNIEKHQGFHLMAFTTYPEAAGNLVVKSRLQI